jgi:hypothetical protein
LIFQIGESFSTPPLPLAAGENVRKPGFWRIKAYKSKTKKILPIFLDIPKGETFAAKSKRAILRACVILWELVDHLSEKN